MFSEHLLTTKTGEAQDVLIRTGWSERAGGFYLVINEVTAEAARNTKEGFLFASTNLSKCHSNPRVFDFFLEVLSGFGIRLPTRMLAEVIFDGQGGVGEKKVVWSAEGVPSRA